MNMKKLAGLLALLWASPALAFQPFTVTDIRIEGIQRTEAGTVFSYLPVKVGETLDEDRAAQAIKALFATGFFKDVRLEVEHGVLVVLVSERPSIASIELNGIKDFPKEQLKSNMRYAGLAEARIFDQGALEKAVHDLKRQYVARGKYGVQVKTRVTPLERNRVAVAFDVVEGEVSKIRQINIVGNEAYKESELLGLLKLSTGGLFSWLTSDDQYSKQKLAGDLEALTSHYMDNGFLEFAINSTQVSISPDKKDIYITINLKEGPRFTVSSIALNADRRAPREELEKLIKIEAGDTFSRKKLTETNKLIGERLGKDGYAFSNVNAVPEVDKEKHEVAFTVMVDPGQRTYIRRINISGNTKTRDEVIRREFRQLEGAWFDVEKIKQSKQHVDKLDFFAAVNLETKPVPGTNDQMDIDLSVEEKSTGNISAGAGFSDADGFSLTGSVTQNNLFGSGNRASVQLNTGKINQVYSFSYTNPYFTDDGVSRGIDIYKRNTDSTTTAVSPYSSHTLGAGMRFGVPLSDESSVNYGLTAERTQLILAETAANQLIDYVNQFGDTSRSVLATLGWSRDSRDSAIYTTEGTIQRVFGELSLPVFDIRYYKLNYQHQWYYPLAKNVTLLVNGEAGIAGGYGGHALPFFKNFYAGGSGSVRGYDSSSLGPRDSAGTILGGSRRLVGNIEVMVPFPGFEQEKSVRLSSFIDGGGVFDSNSTGNNPGSRYSAGAAVTWLSPMGPIKFSYAVPLNARDGDRLQRFQFSLGTVF